MQEILTFKELIRALPGQGAFSKEDTQILVYQDNGGSFSAQERNLHLAQICTKALKRQEAGLGLVTLEPFSKSEEITCQECLESQDFCSADSSMSLTPQSVLYMRSRLLEMLEADKDRELKDFEEFYQTLLDLIPRWTPLNFPDLPLYFFEHPETFLEIINWKDRAEGLFKSKINEMVKEFKSLHLDNFSRYHQKQVNSLLASLAKAKSPSLVKAGAQVKAECARILKESPFYLIQLAPKAPKDVTIISILHSSSNKGLVALSKEEVAYINLVWPQGVLQKVAIARDFSPSGLKELDTLFEEDCQDQLPYASLSTLWKAYALL